ncbi:uncharacterized protein B0P05DRAFT_533437 [Gilbertella persicaria]|uniref:uncharacterized protein n=1 Tax=Gilbertella persicaria TaxID=101096 RepID=UPI0022208B6B|nr:uncharacterized protein B0P05DRAFT_533437 [Gilbertella persicaria]KAI8087034.1 hypothetical protein B0P05DRAFT_533437 [Gilbertella persicaria]
MEFQLSNSILQQQEHNTTALKRKIQVMDSPEEIESSTAKRIQLNSSQHCIAPQNTKHYQISASARANFANMIIESPTNEDMMEEDILTDEEESLKTPSYHPIDLEDEGDLENGGYIGQLERGWSQMFREM